MTAEMDMVSVVIPTLDAAGDLRRLLPALGMQTAPCNVIVVDSGSTDGTPSIANEAGAEVIPITGRFSHGRARNIGLAAAGSAIVVFMTQDAIPADGRAIEQLLKPFADGRVAACYGRQLPHEGASAFAAHARLFNYPAVSHVRVAADRSRHGIRTPFMSNSFAAYRRDCLLAAGGFNESLIMGEDFCAAARLLMAGHAVAYAADATVYHSHDYSAAEEFRRYFDIGVFHSGEPWLLREFGGAGGEGLRFVVSEARSLIQDGKAHLLPSAAGRTVMKYLGYTLGLRYRYLPLALARRLSMHRDWWRGETG